MIEATCSRRDGASVLFNLPGYRVIDAVVTALGVRRVVIESSEAEAGCPSCGVLTSRVHQRITQRVRDVPVAGPVLVVWSKRRFACAETACERRTFAERTTQVPFRARCTTRLREEVLDAVVRFGRAVAEVAGSFGLAWWTVQRTLLAVAPADPDTVPVRRLGIDEHRYRSVRFFRDATGGWVRYEPWMTTFVDLGTGQVLGVVTHVDRVAELLPWPWRARRHSRRRRSATAPDRLPSDGRQPPRDPSMEGSARAHFLDRHGPDPPRSPTHGQLIVVNAILRWA